MEYILCDKFKCLPSELDKQDSKKINWFLYMIKIENTKKPDKNDKNTVVKNNFR